jgi:putative membrane-bound dehydrogenase-like protein
MVASMFLRIPLLLVTAASVQSVLAAAPEPPKAVPAGFTVQLVAMEPEIRTPTAITTDSRGRVWMLENNTHFRPKKYDGPVNDRILILEDFAPDGHARKVTVFADEFRDGMGLQLLSDGEVILSTRSETWCLRDTDGDGRCDQRESLLKLATHDNYPHNGLSGVVVDPAGFLFVGLGENHGAPWTLTGSDGSTVKGSDEGGIFRSGILLP